MKEKGLAPLLIIIIIAVAVLGGYLLYSRQTQVAAPSQQPFDNTQGKPTQPTSNTNLKTYTNTIYNFSFNYPQNLILDVPSLEDKHPDNKTLLQIDLVSDRDFKNKVLLGKQKDLVLVSLHIWDNKSQTLDQGITKWDFFSGNTPHESTKLMSESTSIRIINGITFTVREFTNDLGIPIKDLIAQKGDLLYILTVIPRDSTLIDRAEQTISSFKFLP